MKAKFRAIFQEATAGATLNREAGIIENMVILASESLNGRHYTGNCMLNALPLFENVQVFANHGEEFSRDVKDLLGGYKNVRFEENKVKGDLHLVCGSELKEMIFNIAEKFPNLAGNSIDATGKYYLEGDVTVIEELTHVNSVDIVTKPATTKGFFEEIGEQKMKTLAELKESAPDVYAKAIQEGKDSRKDEVKALTEKVTNLTESNTALEAKVSLQESAGKIDTILKESKLPEDVKTDKLRENLISIGAEKAKDFVVSMEESINTVKGNGDRQEEGDDSDFDIEEVV